MIASLHERRRARTDGELCYPFSRFKPAGVADVGGNEMSNTLTPLEGKTALVTGGTAGIGLACAGALLAAGVTGLVINGRSSERAEQARSGLAARHPAARIYVALGDIIDPGAAQHVAQTAEERLARIDIVLNTS